MRLLSSLFGRPPPHVRPPYETQLAGDRLVLRMPDYSDWKMWRVLRELSQAYLTPWEPEWPKNALSYGYYTSLLRRQWRDWRSGKGYAFSIFLRTESALVLVGGITLGDVQYAAGQKGTIGYWMGLPYAGRGYMTEAVDLVCDFGFNQLHLQRVEASCLPHNEPSKAVLRHCGFEQEGYAKAYLQINGAREDHLLWGKNNPFFGKK